jgi:hypothetical protein
LDNKSPVGFASTSDIFFTGKIINSSNGFVKLGGNTSSVVKGMFYCTKNFSDQWGYGLAAYQPQFSYGTISGPGQVQSINGTYRAGTRYQSLQLLLGAVIATRALVATLITLLLARSPARLQAL